MATKPRHLKTPLQLWIADNRKRLGLTPTDLAQLTGVSTDTARGWESRGRPSEDALSILERRFGVAMPRADQSAEAGVSELVAAIRDQTAAITALVSRLEYLAVDAIRDGVADALREAGLIQDGAGLLPEPPPEQPGGSLPR